MAKSYCFKGLREIDVVYLRDKKIQAIEVKWAKQIRANDLKMLEQFPHSTTLRKSPEQGKINHIIKMPVYQFLYELNKHG